MVDMSQGIVLNDNSRVSISKVTCINWKNQVTSYFGFTGAHNGILINSLFVNTAGANESIYDFDAAMTLSNAQILGNSHNISAGGSIFASGSKDQTSLYFDFKNNTGIADSTVSAVAILTGGTILTDIPVANAAVIVNGSTNFTSKTLERTTVSNTGVIQYTGISDTKLLIDGNISLDPATSTKILKSQVYGIRTTTYTVTFTNATNTINETATALVNGDRITFKDSPGTLPTGITWRREI